MNQSITDGGVCTAGPALKANGSAKKAEYSKIMFMSKYPAKTYDGTID